MVLRLPMKKRVIPAAQKWIELVHTWIEEF